MTPTREASELIDLLGRPSAAPEFLDDRDATELAARIHRVAGSLVGHPTFGPTAGRLLASEFPLAVGDALAWAIELAEGLN